MAKTIVVDGQSFNSKKEAKDFFLEGMLACDGSEADRYMFAVDMISGGYTLIDTYKGEAEKE